MKTNSLRSIRTRFWHYLIWVGIFLAAIMLSVLAFFWRSIPEHGALVTALGLGFLTVYIAAMIGFLRLRDHFINPLIDLGRAARAQKILGIPLNAESYKDTMVAPLAEVLAFHDEGELARANTDEAIEWAHSIGDRPLRTLDFVVFDTETTGLNPQDDDEIIQIGAVRISAGEVKMQEYFARYAHPGRHIPPSSTKIHGIDDRRVADAPPTKEVVQDFCDWSGEAVLVAHNAAFDMAFLRKTGVKFDHAVLDTVFMSAFLFDHTGKHTLDDLTERLHVELPEELRHDAHGDAAGTAEIFVKLIVLLEERGIVTLDDALALGQRMRRIRRAQAIYG